MIEKGYQRLDLVSIFQNVRICTGGIFLGSKERIIFNTFGKHGAAAVHRMM